MSNPIPKDAAAVILLRPNTNPHNPEVYWVKRSIKLKFLGGYRAFPGGQRESSDAEIRVRNCDDDERNSEVDRGRRSWRLWPRGLPNVARKLCLLRFLGHLVSRYRIL